MSAKKKPVIAKATAKKVVAKPAPTYKRLKGK
ncbi:MAG: histone, partial [Acidimicrobiia bacterium]|nr:histone [Acidimicrobiia bacterium]